jgi:hypothetical protein
MSPSDKNDSTPHYLNTAASRDFNPAYDRNGVILDMVGLGRMSIHVRSTSDTDLNAMHYDPLRLCIFFHT